MIDIQREMSERRTRPMNDAEFSAYKAQVYPEAVFEQDRPQVIDTKEQAES